MRSPLAEARNDNGSAPQEGELVGRRYRVEGVIGTGGMGRVVAARDEAGKPIAIKLLLSPPSERVWVERFFREARAVSRINSAHVVKVIAVSSAEEETPYIVMERLRGRDFGKRLRAEGPLSMRDVADCIVQTCDALACSHNVGVVHRDVKPSNLFHHTNPDGTQCVKVLDFGISKARGQEEFEHTLTTTRDGMLGSPPYMSPEHIRDARSVDHRTDIWSLGVVAYQLLAARLPFDGQSVGEVFCAVLERRFSALSKVRPDVPREVEALINRCLSREPGERYQTAAELARAMAPFASPGVQALVARMPVGVPPPASGPGPAGRSSTPIPGMGRRLDGELHTITLPPVGTGEISNASDEAAPTEPTIIPITPPRIAPIINIPPAPKLLHYDDLSAASIEAAKRMRRPKRSVALAAAVAVGMFGLMAVPFLLSGSSSSAKTANTATQLAPAIPAVAVPPAAPAPPPIDTAAAKTATPTKSIATPAPPRDDVTFITPATDRRSALTPPTATPTRTPSRSTGRSTPKTQPKSTHASPPPAAEAKPDPKPEVKPPPPKPERELHPNPYDL